MPQTGCIWSGSGCLLPLLIILNLFFGKLIFKDTGLWLGVGVGLVLIFLLRIKLMFSRASKLFSTQSQDAKYRPPDNVIDIQGEEIDDKQKLG